MMMASGDGKKKRKRDKVRQEAASKGKYDGGFWGGAVDARPGQARQGTGPRSSSGPWIRHCTNPAKFELQGNDPPPNPL